MKIIQRTSYYPKSKSQTHITPDIVFNYIEDVYGITKDQLYDPCPADTPYKAPIFFNGLYGSWNDYNFINPPFEIETLTAFVFKAIEQSFEGRTTIALLPAKTDQRWFHDYIKYRDIQWIRGRLKFKNNKHGATQPHFLVRFQR